MAELKDVVYDIYEMIEPLTHGEDINPALEPHLDQFIEDVRESITHWATPQKGGTLRMSNIGLPDRRLWFDINREGYEHHAPSTLIKFLYGHLLEQLVLLFVRASGHKVTSTQKEVEVGGVKGHMDSVIDGEVVDIKTASGFGFRKFAEGRLPDEDTFGYLGQLAGYEASEGTDEGGFLVINKETGQLFLYIPEDLDKPNGASLVEHKKEIVKSVDIPPDLCYPDIPHGKSGNTTINKLCKYCPHKFECRKDANDGIGLRVFKYASGPEYFTEVLKEPKVQEDKDGQDPF